MNDPEANVHGKSHIYKRQFIPGRNSRYFISANKNCVALFISDADAVGSRALKYPFRTPTLAAFRSPLKNTKWSQNYYCRTGRTTGFFRDRFARSFLPPRTNPSPFSLMPSSHHSLSLLETTLLRGDMVFLVLFFKHWDPATIFALSTTAVWNIPDFLSRWFSNPTEALRLLEVGPALFIGPSVVQFFDRNLVDTASIDVCVGYSGLSAVGRFLCSNGYKFRSSPAHRAQSFDFVAILEASTIPTSRITVEGDRSSTQDQHRSSIFKFVKTGRGRSLRIVVVHLVRCELHRHVFSMHSTSLMSFISATHAVAIFARSTFIKRKSFISCQERREDGDEIIHSERTWIDVYSGDFGPLKLVGSTTRVDQEAEVGRRWLGDSMCWCIPCVWSNEPLSQYPKFNGPAFDVLDWKSGVTRHGSYLRVSEPFIWRFRVDVQHRAWSTTRGFSF
ncbi:hypothetical protein C8R43DRAFT_956111 [Mycena crocata]|nr:hypothetical protein C8R43DRAFT_956111 [Mycena crocata]